jgi:DNA-binding beta-propeller fold protein YncE
MSISKVYVTTAITAIVIAIVTSTTITFPNVAIFATPLFGPEGNDTTTDTTTPPETVGQQEQQTIHITKDGTNSYIISGGSSSVGSFDTTYRIAGERSAIRSAEDLIITTITEDFSSSPTIGYVIATNMTTSSGATNATTATLPNPFATPQQITERISSELRKVIAEGESGTTEGQNVEIKCDFRMSLEDMRCHYIPLLEAAPGDLAATTPTNTTDTGTAGG